MTLTGLIEHFGYPAVWALVMVESAGIPVPGETALLLASAAAGAGLGLHLWGVILAGALGAIMGDNIGYWVGRRGGRPVIERLTQHRWTNPKLLHRAEEFFQKHGGKTVFLGRFIAFLRIFAALLAGVSHMRFSTFFVYNAGGGILWAAIVSLLGFEFGTNLPLIKKALHEIGWAALGVVVVGVIAFFIRQRVQRRRAEARRT